MKHIVEYLSTKIGDSYKLEFPEELDFELITSFFDKKGFTQIDPESYSGYHNIINGFHEMIDYYVGEAKASKTPVYMTIDLDTYKVIRFSMNGNISKDNPIFVCRVPNNKENKQPQSTEDDNGGHVETFRDFNTFRNYVNKFFGWA